MGQASCVLVIFLTYLMGTNFFWMFVEGLYLYILVVKTFSIELVKIHLYTFIGWGIMSLILIILQIKSKSEPKTVKKLIDFYSQHKYHTIP